MCGRYVRKGEPKKIAEFLGVKDGEENWTQSFNVTPTSTIPILTTDPAGRHLVPAVWGFTSTGRASLFNARAETVDSSIASGMPSGITDALSQPVDSMNGVPATGSPFTSSAVMASP